MGYLSLVDLKLLVSLSNALIAILFLGIGFETALALAGRGARIVIADKNDATESIRKIAEETSNKNITYKHLDLSSLTSVRKFAKEINEEEPRLDILINNAGASGLGDQITEDGLQIGMQVNHFGPFLLTHLLIGNIKSRLSW